MVTVEQILKSREERALLQSTLISDFGYPVVSFTMNIAGETKNSPLIRRAFYEGISALCDALGKNNIMCENTKTAPTGCEFVAAVKMDAHKIKKTCVNIEESHPIGRLFDMDVIDTDGTHMERQTPRGCIVCGKEGRSCAARRVHTAKTVYNVSRKLMKDYFLKKDAQTIAETAVQSLKDEAYTTPKPGLVDRDNQGSHKDMDLNLFLKSASCLKEYFNTAFITGYENRHLDTQEIFDILKGIGIKAEKTMYSATGGVNTHKGIIYSMGILCTCLGMAYTHTKPMANLTRVLSYCSALAISSYGKNTEETRSDVIKRLYGLDGIRGEAASGFETVRSIGIKAYEKYLKKELCPNDAGSCTLVELIACTEDTNLYHRGGAEGARWAKESAQSLLKSYKVPSIDKIREIDKEFIKRNLSPGGCADLLALTYFLCRLKN